MKTNVIQFVSREEFEKRKKERHRIKKAKQAIRQRYREQRIKAIRGL